MIQNLDNKIEYNYDSPLNCLFRINNAVEKLGGEKKVGTVFLWDNEIKGYDTLYSFHVWMNDKGVIHDSYKALTDAVNSNKMAGLDFGIVNTPQDWKVLQIALKGGKFPEGKIMTAKLKPYRKKGFDAIYVENYLNIENIKDIDYMQQAIVEHQKAQYNNADFLDVLKTLNTTIPE